MNRKTLKIFLVCLILALSILDAPEYIRCTHIGFCEFLELHYHISNTLKSDLTESTSWVAVKASSLILANLKNSKEIIKGPIISYIPAVLTFFKFPYIPIKRENLYLGNIELPHPVIENSMTSPILRLLGISVIRS